MCAYLPVKIATEVCYKVLNKVQCEKRRLLDTWPLFEIIYVTDFPSRSPNLTVD